MTLYTWTINDESREGTLRDLAIARLQAGAKCKVPDFVSFDVHESSRNFFVGTATDLRTGDTATTR